MGCLVFAAVVLWASLCFAWTNPCYTGMVDSMAVPRTGRSLITLEARRVQSVQGNVIVYDLGKETIVIKLSGVTCQLFLRDIQKGQCKARNVITLEPDETSLSGTRFKASDPMAR
jgi:hypothetical protein